MLEVSTEYGTTWTTTTASQSGLADGTLPVPGERHRCGGECLHHATQTVTIDATAPTAGTLSLTGFTDTGSSSSDGLSNDNAFSLSLTGSEPGSTSVLEVSTDNGVTWTTTTANQSGWPTGHYLFRAIVTECGSRERSTTATQTRSPSIPPPHCGDAVADRLQ